MSLHKTSAITEYDALDAQIRAALLQSVHSEASRNETEAEVWQRILRCITAEARCVPTQ